MQEPNQVTDITTLMEALDGGALGQRLARAVAETARGVIHSEKKSKGKVTLELEITQIGESQQVHIDHTVTFKRPTPRGTASETHKTSTPMYVTARGVLTLLPQQPTGELFKGQGAPSPSTQQ